MSKNLQQINEVSLLNDRSEKAQSSNVMAEKIITNPISKYVVDRVNGSLKKLNFAVPFISSFALAILNKENTRKLRDKRIVTRFDDCGLSSFDLPTLKKLLELGFEIRFENTIHLKLYIIDEQAFITSANLTKGGFEDNFELTVEVQSQQIGRCEQVFEDVWLQSRNNKIDQNLLKANWSKYEVLKKRDAYSRDKAPTVQNGRQAIGDISVSEIIEAVYQRKNYYIERAPHLVFEANKLRDATKDRLTNTGFNKDIFYVTNGKLRQRTLFYDFVYGYESKLAGTGLRETQFKAAFEHPKFNNVITFMLPEVAGLTPWNFSDRDQFLGFCHGIFEFDIPQFKEALPIRLASYFHPSHFLPIYKLDHLKKVAETLGLVSNAETAGDKLFSYNTFLANEMKSLPYDNYVKSNIAYQIMHVVDLNERLRQGETYAAIYNSYDKIWQRDFIENGREILAQLGRKIR